MIVFYFLIFNMQLFNTDLNFKISRYETNR
jgi:hypothetical protein